ncbi:MAG: glutamine--fructose-6-phosphate transaminase (isomerizing) [Elusimicrobiota bacterium]|nr:MAG: glutamine--fructose-6-phosphate transaminase (isomerizing) [Elusimicrobiota bacterium]
MCGIVAYAGGRQAVPILLEGLKRLEYRGYDSAGVAVVSEGRIGLSRSVGKLANLDALLAGAPLLGHLGLGHTRWATHGGPSEANAHPHLDCAGEVAVIHNGIIENHGELKDALTAVGHAFRSGTDTEVVSHLIEEELKRVEPSTAEAELVAAVRAALKRVRGAYALAVIWTRAPGTIVAAKHDSPLVVGLGDGENFIASDVPALLKHTRSVVYLEDGELAILTGRGCEFLDRHGRPSNKIPTVIEWDDSAAEKSGYRHFMLKEIHEQPRAVEATLRGRLLPLNRGVLERETGMSGEYLRSLTGVHFVACGTSWHAATVGKYLIERHAGIPAQVETASEFRYRKPVLKPGTLVVALSQSGETADTLAAVRMAKSQDLKALAISNTVGSAISRASDFNLPTRCGPECGVASTKAFTGQLAALSVLALHLAAARGAAPESESLEWAAQLLTLPDLLRRALELDGQVREIAKEFMASEHFLFIGRGVNYPTALEGALKLKEISYIHAEGFAAGEMKHGPLALIDAAMPVLAIATQADTLEKTLSNIEEARARGARVIALVTRGERRLDGKAEHVLELPACGEFLSPAVAAVPLQLLAYHIADLRGCDVDQPRNLAKSVTVE